MRCLVSVTPIDFRDETLNTVKLFFNKWNIEYKITSYTKRDCVGYHGSVCKPDINSYDVVSSDYDALLIIDGKGIDTYKIYDYRPLLDMVYNFYKNGKFVSAIGNGVKVVARSNIIKNKRISTPEDKSTKGLVLLFHGIPTSDAIEVQDNLCTIGSSDNLDTTLLQMLAHLGIK